MLDEAIELRYRLAQFFKDLDAGFASLQADPAAWQDERNERQLWDSAIADGLDKSGAGKK